MPFSEVRFKYFEKIVTFKSNCAEPQSAHIVRHALTINDSVSASATVQVFSASRTDRSSQPGGFMVRLLGEQAGSR